jgi:hypothetical protein
MSRWADAFRTCPPAMTLLTQCDTVDGRPAEAARVSQSVNTVIAADGLRAVPVSTIGPSLLLTPAWADPTSLPPHGTPCRCCRGAVWWTEVIAPKGWRCRICHPPDHLSPCAVRELPWGAG